jgi:hypothetical protein
VLGLFTLPKVYEMRKDEIDEYLGKAQATVQKQYTTGKAKVRSLTKVDQRFDWNSLLRFQVMSICARLE